MPSIRVVVARDGGNVAFSTPPEIKTFAALSETLAPLGYSISQKARVLDCVEAVAENPEATNPIRLTLGDYLLPALRQAAGPFGRTHPWLEAGDWGYAFKAHFDFVVHAPLDSGHPTHPLFAVEFDGAWAHSTAKSRHLDLAKNRLCAASGLPLVRIDETFLHRRERLSLVEWLATLWADYRANMPRLVAERDAEIQMMGEEELAAAGMWLLGDRPDLDVDLIFRLEHPFPPARRLAERLATRYGFWWWEAPVKLMDEPRWKVARCVPPVPLVSNSPVERWECRLTLAGPGGRTGAIRGLADVRTGYPLRVATVSDRWDTFLAGRLPYLPAGPWSMAPSILGEALCVHNALLRVESYLRHHDRG